MFHHFGHMHGDGAFIVLFVLFVVALVSSAGRQS